MNSLLRIIRPVLFICWLYAGSSNAQAPVITRVSPSSGTPGSKVYITGNNFGNNISVKINGANAEVTSKSKTNITAVIPAGASATGKVSVVSDGNTLGLNDMFVVRTAATTTGTSTSGTTRPSTPTGTSGTNSGPMQITTFSPRSDKTDGKIFIAGKNFGRNPIVKFNGIPARTSVATATTITAHVPAGNASGYITVTCDGSTVSSPGQFTVIASPAGNPGGTGTTPTGSTPAGSAPTGAVRIFNIADPNSPTSQQIYTAARGGIIKVAGRNFSPKASDNTVFFSCDIPLLYRPSGMSSSIKGEVVEASPEGLYVKVRVPQNAYTGKIAISVRDSRGDNRRTADREYMTSDDFYITSASPNPFISSFSPGRGYSGTQVVIEGRFFGFDPNKIQVKFNNLPGRVDRITANGTKLYVYSPVNAPAGRGRIALTVDGKTSTSNSEFEMLQVR